MPLPDAFTRHLEAGELDRIEDLWLTRLAEDPTDIAFYAEAARALRSIGEEDQARFLVEMLEEHLREAGLHGPRLELLRHQGELLHPEPADRHAAIVAALEAAHPGHEHLRPLAEKLGIFRAIEDTPKTWAKVDKLRDLLPYRPGSVVWMEGKGAGRVTEINLALDVLRVHLDVAGTLSVGFAAASKLLRPLPEGHILRRRVEEPDALVALKESDPAELARIALTSHQEPLSANELRQSLAGIVGDDEWTSFWNRVRKNPKVVTLPGKRQQYRWVESSDDAVSALAERFDDAPLADKLDLWRSHAGRDPGLKERMAGGLRREAEAIVGRDPGSAFEIAVALDREGEAGELGAIEVLARQQDPLRLASDLGDLKLRREAFRLLPEVSEDWAALFARALTREEDPRLLDFLADRLGQADPTTRDAAVGALLNQPRNNPAGFAWLAERAADDEEILARNPLRLFLQILAAAGDEVFAAQKRRLLALADSGSTLPRVLPYLDQEQAARAEEALERAHGLENYQRDLLKNAIHLRFPALRQQEAPLYATPESIAAKQEELRRLLEEEIPTNRRAIEEAREMGDLRENFEYKSARQRHEYLTSLSSKIAVELERARPIDFAQVDASTVRVGTRVRLRGSGGERQYAILGPWESQPEEGILSNESEVAESLLGKATGDAVELEGGRWEVVAIEPYR